MVNAGRNVFMRLARSLAIVSFVPALSIGSACAEPVAIITDLLGQVTAEADKPVSILAEVEAGMRLQLGAGARVVAVYLKSGEEYAVTGPARVEFRGDTLYGLSGAKPQKRASPLGKGGKDVIIKPVGVTQAAFVMRSGRPTARIKLLTLSGTRTLDASPEFRWQELEAGARYRFELTDDTGRSLHDADLESTSLKLPLSVQLREGVTHTWEISARLADGRRYVSAGDFSIAPADLRSEVELLRPAPGAPVSERVAFAAWLEQMELRDEARQYWKALAVERPRDTRLKAMAGE